MFSWAPLTPTKITRSAQWTAAITYVDRLPFKNRRKPLINASRSTTWAQVLLGGERQGERKTLSWRCSLCKWALLNLLANGRWFSPADWLIGLWHGGVCCSVSSPRHRNHREHTHSHAVQSHPMLRTAAITGECVKEREAEVEVEGARGRKEVEGDSQTNPPLYN